MKSPKDYRPPWLWRRPVGPLWLRPWYDGLATWSVARLHLPLSRAWAAAEAKEGSALERHLAADAAWRQGFFAPEPPTPEELAGLERARRAAAANWMGRRIRHLPSLAGVSAAAFAIEPPDRVEVRHGQRLARPETAFPLLDAVPEESHSLRQAAGLSCWLRFAARDGGTAWARLDRPASDVRGTVIALHGICIEADFWPHSPDYSDRALAAGWQILRIEAPWHGRRRLPGTYGGEPLIARGPAGFLEFFELAVPELAVWTAWAKRQGPVVWSGVSLGALTAQKAVEVARHWPEESRPDGLLLITTAADVTQGTPEGSLGRFLRLRPRLQAAGWSEPALARWIPLLNPLGGPVLPPQRLRLLLGSADRLLPFAQGVALAQRWKLPAERVTVRPQGHFSVSLGLLAQPEPLLDLLREVAL